MTAPASFIVYLGRDGDSIRIENFGIPAVLPAQAEALACRTHEQVLAFLERIKTSELRNALEFYHEHNTSYDGHLGTWPKGQAHPCSLDTQIGFVRYKIGEREHGIRHAPLKEPGSCVIS